MVEIHLMENNDENTAPNIPLSLEKYSEKVVLIEQTDHIRQLHTVLRDKNTCRNDFIFNADRLIRLVIEEGLNQLPHQDQIVTTPTDGSFHGIQFAKRNCGVSVIRSGEAMERGLRDCCRSIRIGKILIQTAEENGTQEPKVYYAKLPSEIENRKVLLMYPTLNSGNTLLKALEVLQSYAVPMQNVILLTLFSSPKGLENILSRNPDITIVTSEIHPLVPNHFGTRYFGTC